MKISVITCTWNSSTFLPDSIASVLAQDHEDIEYIFVDGGSTDATLDMIAAVPRPVTLLENIRGGISRAMNEGLAAASGDVIAHLHSDDYYAFDGALKRVSEAFEREQTGWVFGRCLSDIDGQRQAEGYVVPRYSYSRLLKGNFIPHPATFVRRELFERVGRFDETIKYAMDYDMWLRLGKLSAPAQLDDYLSVFRRHSGSISTANQLASLADDYRVRMEYASPTPWSRAYHFAHYLVRRRRVARVLAASAIPG